MSGLLIIQNQLQNYLLYSQNNIKKLIVATKQISAEARLAIYHDAYRLRLIEAMASNYPILHIYLGDELFEKMAREYIAQYPSSYKSIRWYGNYLESFLTSQQEYKIYPYLVELAKFEWTNTLVFDAADNEVLKIEDIAKISPPLWENMILVPHPSLYRINLSWNVVAIWQALNDQQSPPEPMQSPVSVPWVLWRRDLINRFCSLPSDEAWAIDAVLQKNTFGDICAGLCQWVDDGDEQAAGQRAAALLKGWISAGLVSEVII